MAETTAIILAAGVGSRLRPLTQHLPKCLLEVGMQTIIDRQVTSLHQNGVTDVLVVLGFCGEQIRLHLGDRARYLENPRYEDTNSLYSLWLARDALAHGALILNSDVLALPLLFGHLLQSPAPDAVLVELGDRFEPEDMKVRLDEGLRILDFGKDLAPEHSHGHNVGMAKFSRDSAAHLVDCLEQLVGSGHENDWAPVAFRKFARHWPLTAVSTEGLPWIEIDYPQDLARARVEIEPAILALEDACSAR
jgi:choline kinase